jgi:hypothetical protein
MTTTDITIDATTVESLARGVVDANPPGSVPLIQLMGAWYDAGLAWIHFPVGLGGLDGPRSLQPLANRIMREAG